MATVNVWSKVAVAVQTALGTAKVITAITKANPAVATSTAHALTNGMLVLLKVNGMRQLDWRIVRVANQAANTFELEGVNSTAFDTFTSGTAEAITFGANASTFQDINITGGEAAAIPLELIHDDQNYELPGNRSPLVATFGSIWDVADAALLALQGFDSLKSPCAVSFTFATGAKIYFAAYPSASLAPNGSAGQVVTTPVTLRFAGRLTTYAT